MKILLVPILAAFLFYPSTFYVTPRYSTVVSAALTHLDQCAPDAAQMIRENVYYVGHSDRTDLVSMADGRMVVVPYPFSIGGRIFLIDEPTDELTLTYFVHEARHAWQAHHPEYWLDIARYNVDQFARFRIEVDAIEYAVAVRKLCYPNYVP